MLNYVFHWYIGSLINGFRQLMNFSYLVRIILYFVVTLISTILIKYIFDHWKNTKYKRKLKVLEL